MGQEKRSEKLKREADELAAKKLADEAALAEKMKQDEEKSNEVSDDDLSDDKDLTDIVDEKTDIVEDKSETEIETETETETETEIEVEKPKEIVYPLTLNITNKSDGLLPIPFAGLELNTGESGKYVAINQRNHKRLLDACKDYAFIHKGEILVE